MGTIDLYMAELTAALHVRGAARRRFLRECRDHLDQAASERGTDEAVRAFGPASEIASAFDAEIATGRSVRSTFFTVAGVLAAGGSTLALVNSSSTNATAPVAWAITFFVCAQLAGLTAGLALVQALVQRRSTMERAQALLLARRNACALLAASVTILSAGGAVSGRGSAAVILAGPALVCAAMVTVLRARSLARRIDRPGSLANRPPLEDITRLIHLPNALVDPSRLLAGTMCLAAAAAFVRDRAEHASVGDAFMTSAIEATAIVVCFLVLGPALGLRRR